MHRDDIIIRKYVLGSSSGLKIMVILRNLVVNNKRESFAHNVTSCQKSGKCLIRELAYKAFDRIIRSIVRQPRSQIFHF